MEEYLAWELSVLDWIAGHIQSDLMDELMPLVSSLGNQGLVWILLALILLCLPKERKHGIQLLLAMGFSLVFCNLMLKNFVGRVRPFDLVGGIELLVQAPKDYSFPSGHTSSAFATAIVMFMSRSKTAYYLLGLAVLMAFSRMYLYVHYPTDILGGIVTGVVSGILAAKTYQLLESALRKRRRRKHGV